jgi:subtilisin family serine protease|tara:strand:+ start:41 stop:1645 length:1605 start_codon:yes stop_codon:yes gene_type:complete
MKKLLFLFFNCLLTLTVYSQDEEHSIILKLKKSNNLKTKNVDLSSEFNKINKNITPSFRELKIDPNNKLLRLTFPKNISIDSVLSVYKKSGKYEFVEQDYVGYGSGVQVSPNDNFFDLQYSLKNDGSFNTNFMSEMNIVSVTGADINIEGLWDYTKGDQELIVAVIDSGMNMTHEDLQGRFWVNDDEIIGNNIDDDGNGFIDDVNGWDFINNDNDPSDDHGHGTNVGSIAMATGNNSFGISGVNWNSKIMVVKSLNENNSGSYSAMIESIYYAVDNGARVINFSIGGSGYSESLKDAVNYCYDNNVVFVACMMNYDNETTYYPAGFEKVIAVGATDPRDYRASPFNWTFVDGSSSGSNFGNHIDLVAPGLQIVGASSSSDSGYSYWSGTSQATPLVAGVASLLLSVNSTLTIDELKNYLINSADDQVGNPAEDISGWDKYYGHGRLNATNAVNQILTTNKTDNFKITILPNPTQDFFTINYPLRVSTQIFDLKGAIIKKTKDKRVNISNLESGIYLVVITDSSGQVNFHKLIKR